MKILDSFIFIFLSFSVCCLFLVILYYHSFICLSSSILNFPRKLSIIFRLIFRVQLRILYRIKFSATTKVFCILYQIFRRLQCSVYYTALVFYTNFPQIVYYTMKSILYESSVKRYIIPLSILYLVVYYTNLPLKTLV